MEFGLRPLDELDQRRIEAGKTPDSVRPDCSESESEYEAEELERQRAEVEPPKQGESQLSRSSLSQSPCGKESDSDWDYPCFGGSISCLVDSAG